ncbi:MAG: 16S rRNA processing protein RimM [Nitrospirae bacterium]|nr:16S rRNA processing protein RimM [Nitrospirota bacterium]
MTVGGVIVGKIVRPHGLSGDLKIRPLTDNPDRFSPGRKVVVRSPGGQEIEVMMERVGVLQDHLLVAFAGYRSRSQVEPWVGGWILVPEQEVPNLPDGRYYHFQILGMRVFDQESGEPLGEVVDIFSTGSNDVYVLRHGKKEYLIPATREVVREVDVHGKRMTISRLHGLIE